MGVESTGEGRHNFSGNVLMDRVFVYFNFEYNSLAVLMWLLNNRAPLLEALVSTAGNFQENSCGAPVDVGGQLTGGC